MSENMFDEDTLFELGCRLDRHIRARGDIQRGLNYVGQVPKLLGNRLSRSHLHLVVDRSAHRPLGDGFDIPFPNSGNLRQKR